MSLPVLPAQTPLAKCGACGADLYAHTTCRAVSLGVQDACPLRSLEWARMMQARAMQNMAPAKSSTAVLTHGYDDDGPEAA